MRSLAFLVALITVTFGAAQQPNPEAKKGPDEAKPKPYADKFIHAPSPVPDRVILTWSGNTSTTQSVTWRTDTSVTEAVGQITEATPHASFDPGWGKNAKAADVVRTTPAKTELLKTDLNDCHCHSVTFRGLKPKTKYVYRVGAAPNWSEWFQFETAADTAEAFGFIYVGDAQDDIKRHWSRCIRQAMADMPKAKFFLHAGDLISRSNSDGQWGEWFNAVGWTNGSIPSIPSPGNHEYGPAPRTAAQIEEDKLEAAAGTGLIAPKKPARPSVVTSHWRAQFTLPEHGPAGLEETCYFLDVQGVRIICLNSMEKVEEQTPWLEGVLKDNPHRWTIVTFHVPAYSTAASRQKNEENKSVRKFWRPILDKYGVDLVLQGHDHSYGRSGLLRDDLILPEDSNKKGSVYVVSVSGPKMYDVGTQPWMVTNAQMKQLYQLIRVNGDKLSFEARTADGELFDAFELRKQTDGRSELVEQASLESENRNPSGTGGRETLFALGGMALLAGGYAGLRVLRRG